jgi:hypothetical protein
MIAYQQQQMMMQQQQQQQMMEQQQQVTTAYIPLHTLHTAMNKVSNRNARDFGWENSHEAVSRRPPIPLYTIVPRTHMYTYDATVWDLSIVQGPFSVAPRQTLRYDSQLLHRCTMQRLHLPVCLDVWGPNH